MDQKLIIVLIIQLIQIYICEALSIVCVRTGNEVIGLNLTWAHNLFMKWVLGFPTLGRSRHRDSK